MTDEQIEQLAYKHSCDDDEPLFSFSRRDLFAFANSLLSASIADTAGAKPDLHAQIMNIRCATPKDYGINMRIAYQQGHRDARHAAADIANIAAPPAPSVADAAGAMRDADGECCACPLCKEAR